VCGEVFGGSGVVEMVFFGVFYELGVVCGEYDVFFGVLLVEGVS